MTSTGTRVFRLDDLGFHRAGVLLLLGNLLDGLFTFTFLQLRMVDEANPLLSWIYGASPLSFMLFKLSCMQFGLLVLWQHRHRVAAGLAVRASAGMYAAVVAYHCSIAVSPPV